MSMGYERDDARRRITALGEGNFCAEDALAIFERMRADGTWHYGALYDLRRMTGQSSVSDLRRIVTGASRLGSDGRPAGPMAFVADTCALYAMACTYSALGPSGPVDVFSNREDAEAWLVEQTARGSSGRAQGQANRDTLLVEVQGRSVQVSVRRDLLGAAAPTCERWLGFAACSISAQSASSHCIVGEAYRVTVYAWPEGLSSGAGLERMRVCSIDTTIDCCILAASGDLRHFFNTSSRAIQGRDMYLFVEKDRTLVRQAMILAAPNVSVERDLVLRPLDRRPVVVRALITRDSDDLTFRWELSELPRQIP